MAKEVSSYEITVNAICPRLIDTEMARKDCHPDMIKKCQASFPAPRLGPPVEVAQLALFLCKDEIIFLKNNRSWQAVDSDQALDHGDAQRDRRSAPDTELHFCHI
jgi:NAD(P)-dependent dehydrogenase (short-subunit alcohol dehydrogenase family)